MFSLVREFLEYFGLDYTISVYDPETYSGKEYNYAGRSKLSEELGIVSSEPLLGEILRNHAPRVFRDSQEVRNEKKKLDAIFGPKIFSIVILHFQNDDNGNESVKTLHNESNNVCNKTFDDIVPKMIHKDSVSLSNDNDSSEKIESVSESGLKIPINVTISDKKKANGNQTTFNNVLIDTSSCELQKNNSSRKNDKNSDSEVADGNKENNDSRSLRYPNSGDDSDRHSLNKTEPLIKFDESIVVDEGKPNRNENSVLNNTDLHNANNVQNKKINTDNKTIGKTVYFDEIISDGKKEKVSGNHKSEASLLGELPPLATKTNSIFGDLPSLNTKKADINELKELMDIGLGAFCEVLGER